LQSGGTPGIEADPLLSGIVYLDRDEHPAWSDFEWENLHASLGRRFAQNADRLTLEIHLDNAVVEEIRSNDSVHRRVGARLAQFA
jgi:hypothetical protein